LGGAVEPRVVAGLALLRNRVEGPEALARANVEAANVAFVVLEAFRRRALPERRADHDHIAPDDRRALKTDLAGDEIRKNRLVDVRLEINGAVRAEARNRVARFCVERDETIAGRDIQNSFFAAIGPIRETATRERTRCRGAART